MVCIWRRGKAEPYHIFTTFPRKVRAAANGLATPETQWRPGLTDAAWQCLDDSKTTLLEAGLTPNATLRLSKAKAGLGAAS
jgi:hypothetical protein